MLQYKTITEDSMIESKVTTLDEFIIKSKQEMYRRRINQNALAELTGVPKSTIAKVLCGVTKCPKEKTLIAIAQELNIDISELDIIKSQIPHNRFNPNRYFKNADFDTYLNESIEKVNEAIEQLDEILGILLTIKQGVRINERIQNEITI